MDLRRWIAVMSAALGGCGAITGLDSLKLGGGVVPGGDGGVTAVTGAGGAPGNGGSTSSGGAGGAPTTGSSISSAGPGGAGGGSTSSSGNAACGVVGGLLAYYPLDVDTLDHSGNGNDAVGESLTPASGKVGGAFAFDGTSSSLHATGSATLGGARTLCAWVDPSPTSGLGQPIFSGGKPHTGDFFSISASSPAGGTCTFLAPDVPFIDHWGTPCDAGQGQALPPDGWHFVCFVYDGTSAVTLYGDGNAAPTNSKEYDYPLDTLFIGSATIGGTTTQPVLLGTLDEVTVWGRALEASELDMLWNGGAGCTAL